MNLTNKTIEQSTGKFLVKVRDSFLAEDFLRQMQMLLKDYQYVRCTDLENFLETCNSSSLFDADKRILVLPDIEKDDVEVLAEAVDIKTEDILVLLETTTLLKTKPYTKLKALCTYIDLKEPTESERSVWVKRWIGEAGLTCGDEIPGYIVSRSGADLCRLRNEVKKLSFLLMDAEKKVVTREVCDEIVAANRESQYFVFMENFFRKKLPEVLTDLKKVDEYSYIKLLHFMIGQVDRTYKIAVYKEQGMNAEQIGEIVGVPTFIVKTKLFTALSFYGKIKLLMLSDLLNKLDVELRSSKFPKYNVFESYLIKAMKL